MDPADGVCFAGGQLRLEHIEPMKDFDFGIGSTSQHGFHHHVSDQGDLEDLGNTEGLDWNLLPNDAFPQPPFVDEYQGFANHSYPNQDGFAHSLPTLPERRLFELEGFSPLSTQTSNETLTTTAAEQHPRRRSIRKRRIENGYHCNEPYCGEAFDTAGELTKHCWRKHTPESAWPFACPVCGKRFYDKRDYGRHENVERKRASAVASVVRSVPGSPKQLSLAKEENQGENIETTPSRRQSEMVLRPEMRNHDDDDHDNEKTCLEFTRANDHHTSPTTLLLAATSDLKRFVNLGANHITIKAIIPSHNESMNISSTHTLTKTSPTGMEDIPNSSVQSQPLSSQPETSKPDTVDVAAIKIDRQKAISLPISVVKPLPPVVKAVTLTFRSRPAFPRSLTHPAGLRMVGVGCC